MGPERVVRPVTLKSGRWHEQWRPITHALIPARSRYVKETSDAKPAEKSKTSMSTNARHVASESVIGAKTKGLLGSGKSSCSSMEVLRLSCQPTVAVGQGGNVDMASPMARATAIATVIAIVTARAMRIAIVIARAMAMSIATARAMGIATVMTRAPRGRASPAHVTRQVIL